MPVSKRKTRSNECVFSFLQRILGVCTVRVPCPANKNLQIADKTIAQRCFDLCVLNMRDKRKRRGNMIKIERG